MLPVNIVDVAGLVEGAHEGKGRGNQFLNDLATADAFMLVVDMSGKTDKFGNPSEGSDPSDDVSMVIDELNKWLFGIIKRNLPSIQRAKTPDALQNVLSSFKIKKEDMDYALQSCALLPAGTNWKDRDIEAFAKALISRSKPVIVLANKMDKKGAQENLERVKSKLSGFPVFECSAAIEMALRKAAAQGVIDYTPGATTFSVTGKATEEQKAGLEYMRKFIGLKGTGVQAALNLIVFKVLDNIVAYPVEDETKYTDHFGNVLPDAILLKKGSTATDLAATIHSDLADHMLYAIDAVKKMRVAKSYVLNDGDVLKIVSTVK